MFSLPPPATPLCSAPFSAEQQHCIRFTARNKQSPPISSLRLCQPTGGLQDWFSFIHGTQRFLQFVLDEPVIQNPSGSVWSSVWFLGIVSLFRKQRPPPTTPNKTSSCKQIRGKKKKSNPNLCFSGLLRLTSATLISQKQFAHSDALQTLCSKPLAWNRVSHLSLKPFLRTAAR